MTPVPVPQSGDIVRVRQRQYLVEEVVPGEGGHNATKVGMACVDDDAQGQRLEVLWEKEIDALNESEDAWAQIGKKPFDAPELFSAYLHTLQWNCVTATDAKLFQSPFRAGIKVDAYQLEPLRKALQLPRVSLFIADDVGLGKTIESGLIARELLLRRKVRDIVVVYRGQVRGHAVDGRGLEILRAGQECRRGREADRRRVFQPNRRPGRQSAPRSAPAGWSPPAP